MKVNGYIYCITHSHTLTTFVKVNTLTTRHTQPNAKKNKEKWPRIYPLLIFRYDHNPHSPCCTDWSRKSFYLLYLQRCETSRYTTPQPFKALSMDPLVLDPARQRDEKGEDEQRTKMIRWKIEEGDENEEDSARLSCSLHMLMPVLAHKFTTARRTHTTQEHNLWRIVMWHSRLDKSGSEGQHVLYCSTGRHRHTS